MSSIQNPFNNVGSFLPPQPFGSVVDQVKNNENVLIETAGLDPYTFVDIWERIKRLESFTTGSKFSIYHQIEQMNLI